MLTATHGAPDTVRDVLFADGDARALVAARVGEGTDDQTLARLGGMLGSAARGAVVDRLVAAVEGVTDLDLVDILVAGWRKHRALRDAARRTIDAASTPGGIVEEVVDLAEHRITSRHEPGIDVVANGVRLGTVAVTVRLQATLTGLAATVRAGRLVSIGGGRAELEATLGIGGVDLLERSRTFDLRLIADLGGGFPLLSGARDRPLDAPPPTGPPVA